MKWLEGSFGAISTVLGAGWIGALALVMVNMRWSYSDCLASGEGPGGCSRADLNISALVFSGVVVLLYIGVLVGTWLDLLGRRRAGRGILVASASLQIIATLGAINAFGSFSGGDAMYILPMLALAIAAAILACARSDAPAPTALG